MISIFLSFKVTKATLKAEKAISGVLKLYLLKANTGSVSKYRCTTVRIIRPLSYFIIMIFFGILSVKGIRKNVPNFEVFEATPAPPTTLSIYIVIVVHYQ